MESESVQSLQREQTRTNNNFTTEANISQNLTAKPPSYLSLHNVNYEVICVKKIRLFALKK